MTSSHLTYIKLSSINKKRANSSSFDIYLFAYTKELKSLFTQRVVGWSVLYKIDSKWGKLWWSFIKFGNRSPPPSESSLSSNPCCTIWNLNQNRSWLGCFFTPRTQSIRERFWNRTSTTSSPGAKTPLTPSQTLSVGDDPPSRSDSIYLIATCF